MANEIKKSDSVAAIVANRTIQEYLSVGYLFLIILGLTKDVIMYAFLDIHILRYSTVLDVLISPIAFLSESMLVLPTLIGLVIVMIYLVKTANPKLHFKFREKTWYKKIVNIEKYDSKYSKPQSFEGIALVVAIGLASFYLGSGLGQGEKLSKRLENKEIKLDHTLTFRDKSLVNVEVVGVNSEYVFYVAEGNDKVTVSPIQENIKSIDLLEKKDKK